MKQDLSMNIIAVIIIITNMVMMNYIIAAAINIPVQKDRVVPE
jgi:hypothetical protein